MIDIREAREEDLRTILKLLEENDMYTKDVEKLLSTFILAVDDNKIVGCLAHMIFENGVFVLRSMAIAEQYKRKGIAIRLNKLKIEWASKNNFKRVYARTLKTNEGAKNLLGNKLGFTVIGGQESYGYFPNCDYCRGSYDRMIPYCKEHSPDEKCPMLTYGLNI